jgi:hypothetical protein
MTDRVHLDLDDAEAGVAGAHPQREPFRVRVAPSLTAATVPFNAIEPGLFSVACWRMDDARFDFDSSFVMPAAKKELGLLRVVHDEHPGCPMTVFGHADPTGTDDYNKALSGRRARSIHALLVRDVDAWEDLYSHPFGGDQWGPRHIKHMLSAVSSSSGPPYAEVAPGPGNASTAAIRLFQEENGLAVDGDAGPNTRRALFAAYMDVLCDGEALHPERSEFLGRDALGGGKADYQGCSELNPVLVFSKEEAARLDQPAHHGERNAQNSVNRRVVIFFLRKGTQVDDASWPCPRVSEGSAACKGRFWSDGEVRRAPQAERRLYEKTRDTFACRFYDRLAMRSPCEGAAPLLLLHVRLCDYEKEPIGGAPFRVRHGTSERSGVALPDGFITLIALRIPEMVRLEWTRPELVEEPEYPFRREIFVDVGGDDPSDDKRLHNLGYVAAERAVNVRAYQSDFGHTETGILDDIRAELREFHDGGARPASPTGGA